MVTLQKRLGMRIAAARRDIKLTQEKLAELVGCSVDTISSVERGTRAPSLDLLEQLAPILQTSVSNLFDFEAFDKEVGDIEDEDLESVPLTHINDQLLVNEVLSTDVIRVPELKSPIQNGGAFLSSHEVILLQEYLTLYLSLPFIKDLSGEAAEQIISLARGAQWSGKRANRPEPDIILNGVNYSIKTEKTSGTTPTSRRLGTTEDIITARIPVGDIGGRPPSQIGKLVLEAYNRDIVQKYNWHKIGILLRFRDNTEFIYFEEDAAIYDSNDYEWSWTKRGKDRNIQANKKCDGKPVFRWNAGTTLLYVIHEIPGDADVFSIQKQSLVIETLRQLIFKNS